MGKENKRQGGEVWWRDFEDGNELMDMTSGEPPVVSLLRCRLGPSRAPGVKLPEMHGLPQCASEQRGKRIFNRDDWKKERREYQEEEKKEYGRWNSWLSGGELFGAVWYSPTTVTYNGYVFIALLPILLIYFSFFMCIDLFWMHLTVKLYDVWRTEKLNVTVLCMLVCRLFYIQPTRRYPTEGYSIVTLITMCFEYGPERLEWQLDTSNVYNSRHVAFLIYSLGQGSDIHQLWSLLLWNEYLDPSCKRHPAPGPMLLFTMKSLPQAVFVNVYVSWSVEA